MSAKKRKSRQSSAGLFAAVFFITIAVVAVTVGATWAIMTHIADDNGYDLSLHGKDSVPGSDTGGESKESGEPDVSDTSSPVESETVSDAGTDVPDTSDETAPYVQPDNLVMITIGEDDLRSGALVLCNPDHSYEYPNPAKLPTIYSKKTRDYKVATSESCLTAESISALNSLMAAFREATGKNDVNVTTAYRTTDEQMDIYSAYVSRYGIAAAEGNVAAGGCSDHNTGLGFDLCVYTAEGVTENLGYDSTYSWIANNCYKYGIIRRYSTPKTQYTKLYEEWHFRYVGVAHAYYMRKNDLCLEEYIDELAKYPFEGEHLGFSDDAGNTWEIFSAPISNDGSCTFGVPEGAEYSVSPTNTGMAVVTIKLY